MENVLMQICRKTAFVYFSSYYLQINIITCWRNYLYFFMTVFLWIVLF